MRWYEGVPRVVRLFLVAAFLLDSIAVVCELVARFGLHYGWPYRFPLLDEKTLPDLNNFVPPFAHLHTAAFFDLSYPAPFMYPAPVAPLYAFFLRMPHRTMVFESVLAAVFLVAAVLFGRHLSKKGTSVTGSILVAGGALLLSYPVAFELRQGNMELFVCVLVAAGVWLMQRGNFHRAAVCIGIAGAMKLFPFVYLGLFLSRRLYRPFMTAILSAVLATVASLLYLFPVLGVAWRGIVGGLNHYQRTTALVVRREIGFDHSLFAMIKLLAHHHFATPERVAPILRGYLLAAAVLGVALFVLRIRHMPIVNQVMALCVASILLPPVSYDYTLIHLYVPWAMLVILAMDQRGRVVAGLAAAFFCLAFLTSVQTEFIHHGRTYEGQLKGIVLVLLFYIALKYPFGPTRDSALTEATAL